MFRFILILFLLLFLLPRIGGFLIRALFWVVGIRAMQKQAQHQTYQQKNRRQEGDITIITAEQAARASGKKAKKDEYVDYEEVD